MAFDLRILKLAPFMPHSLEVVQRALPPGSIDQAVYDTIQKRYARVHDAEIQRLEYKVDGLRVTGAAVLPKTIEAKRHPLLVYNRGGTGDYGMLVLGVMMRYLLPFAQQGYLVFGSNYRGNDGGDGAEEFGGADINDVLTLLDIARHHPGWDGKNAFMFGGSRGGMMTYLAIKAGAELNAAATFGAPSDARALAAERPDMEMKVFARRIPEYADDPDGAFATRSALAWPEMLQRVPLLLMHGLSDETVRPSHTQRLGEALATHPDSKTVLYEGGNHSLSTHAAAMLQETKDWFALHRR